MDLKNVWDHPANILTTKAADSRVRFNHVDAWGMRKAAEVLRDYERTQGVVFAALDEDNLDILRSAQMTCEMMVGHPEFVEEAERLMSAIDQLLGSPEDEA